MNNKQSSTRELVTMIWGKKKIDAKQLLLLLQHDETIKHEIRSIVINRMSTKESDMTDESPIEENNQITETLEIPSTQALPVATELSFEPEQQMLDILLEDKELTNHWIKADTSRDRQIVALIVAASQWNNIQRLWKNIAKRCNKRKGSSTENERLFLQGCLDLHNLQWKESEVRFDKPIKGDLYAHEKHQRASITPIGENIEEIWLYGLINVDGKPNKQHKSIVVTK